MSDLEYLNLRVHVLEELISDIVIYHMSKNDRYNTCLPTEANFWNEQIAPKIERLKAELDDVAQDKRDSND